ncbi:unnamed protein product [Angiostrongylus costaricensis]|uniref:Beta-lactamase domain-containing protein n=1 Tax=Angiostrongylus costaricensis TaxID=334426 RepID=A0A158PGY3_ANGCS|nr:unnamed protein product [Angiostrongylus costaricensis]
MALLRYASILGAFGMVAHIVTNILYTEYPLHFDGETEEGFDDVRKAFRQNFLDGWEAEGASLAVFVKGQKVVDIWGGYADKHAARKWRQDTLSVVFSSTKAVAALCIAVLADRGRLSYDDLIAVDHNLMKNVLEEEKPKVTPGISTGYHAFTFGWLVDQIVRHTDEKQRGIGQFLREEVTEPNGIDFHIGLDLSQEYRVARVSLPKILDVISEVWSDTYMIEQFFHFVTLGKNSAFHRAANNPSWINVLFKCTVNNPEQHAMEQAAALGIGNARSLATMFNLLVTGHLVSEKTLAILQKPVINGTDYVINVPVAKGHGFLYVPIPQAKDSILIIHPGNGCQQISFDIHNQIVVSYVTNGLKVGNFDHCRNYKRIHYAIYDALELKEA